MATKEELEAKVAAVRAKRAKEKEAGDDVIAIRMLEGELKLDELVEQHGELGRKIAAVFSPTTGDMAVVKRPSRAAFKAYQNGMNSGKLPPDQVMTNFVNSCLIYPDLAGFGKVQDDTPSMLGKLSNAAARLAGVSQDDIEGK